MKIVIHKSFQKDASSIIDAKENKKIADTIQKFSDFCQLSDIKNLKKLSGKKNYYRLRIGDYRLGLIIENDNVHFVRILHRKDIYKYFP